MKIDWTEYLRVHASRTNLLIHLFAVPLFIASAFSLVKYVVRGDWVSAAVVAACAVLAMALQARAHRAEPNRPRPFSGPLNFLRRWFNEQFVIFPMFLFTGRWWRQWKAAGIFDES